MIPRAMTNKRHNFASGFTLIEIVVVVTVLAILAVLALPNPASQTGLTASAASRVVVADLLYAQSQAISTQTTQYVSFTEASSAPNGSWGAYSLYNSEPFAAAIENPVTKQPYTQLFGTGGVGPLASVALTNLTLDDSANTVLAFNELGQPYASPVNGTLVPLANTGTVALQCGTMSVTISIEPSTGNITVSQ
jgi:prepilin-type N-terminal cleavage/methylation domain-containing protein